MMDTDEWVWVQKYRPHTINECILPERIKSVFQAFVTDGNVPNLMLTGSAGVGKTTIARALCEEIGLNHYFINASKERGIDTLRSKITGYASTVSLNGKPKVIILDEADYMTPEMQAALRGAIEEFSKNCTFIFTCNYAGRLIDALHSRCTVIDFKIKKDERLPMAKAFLDRLFMILKAEKVDYNKKAVAAIVEKRFPDFRKTLNDLQRFAQCDGLKNEVIDDILDDKNFQELIKALKNNDWSAMRKWVATNIENTDSAKFYRKLYDTLYTYMKRESIPAAVIFIGQYQYYHAFVADPEINVVACLTEIMGECEWL